MDDKCVVCKEDLEWVAHGACGHRDVCSTCVFRLRCICDDRRCCICKTESSIVFVTKNYGNFTRIINDFSLLPPEPKEGRMEYWYHEDTQAFFDDVDHNKMIPEPKERRMGSCWYHEDTQAFFDDVDHYKMIEAMFRLSCTVCDKEESNDGSKRRGEFRNINQLKGHLFDQHKLRMCSLCLEGRKVFICEQKLYTRAQLNQHISTGDSEVDGSESERGGFMGHPMCEFCKTPFYGDNELRTHMLNEHYSCHLCQRQHPGQHKYGKNYDDLEMHFRRDHFLCDVEGCLAKKFIVFQTEAELKVIEKAPLTFLIMNTFQATVSLCVPTSHHKGAELGDIIRMNMLVICLVLSVLSEMLLARYPLVFDIVNRQGRGRTFRRQVS